MLNEKQKSIKLIGENDCLIEAVNSGLLNVVRIK